MLTTLPQKVEPAHTALILVDVLNAFCAKTAPCTAKAATYRWSSQ